MCLCLTKNARKFNKDSLMAVLQLGWELFKHNYENIKRKRTDVAYPSRAPLSTALFQYFLYISINFKLNSKLFI